MDMVDIVLALVFCAFIGWAVHKIMGRGNHGTGLLHYAFVGGCGVGIGALFEWITGLYATTIIGAILPCFIYACIVEWIIRKVKHRLWVREVHKKGWLTQEDMHQEFHIVPDDLRGYEGVESDE